MQLLCKIFFLWYSSLIDVAVCTAWLKTFALKSLCCYSEDGVSSLVQHVALRGCLFCWQRYGSSPFDVLGPVRVATAVEVLVT